MEAPKQNFAFGVFVSAGRELKLSRVSSCSCVRVRARARVRVRVRIRVRVRVST